jgi:tetratricopeptide (TPR) repeat protein
VLRVAPLGLPDATDDDADLEADATRLFLDRARAASPGFSPSDADARAIVQICRQVDGIPLAIELAAARVGTISVEEIASLLRERLHLLGGGDTVRVRHRTVEGLIDWSYDLLAGAEQELFDRLSVFAGRFTAAAARSVCWEGDGDDVLDLLTLLADRSLIVSEPPNGERATRYYRLLELPRRYGWENVRVAQQGEAVRERHLAWYLRFADEASAGLRGPDQGRWIGLVEAEHDNLRAALAWALDRDAVQAALALCGALWWFWWVRGYTTEGLAWLERALAAGESSGARIDALEGACRLATVRGDLGGARRFGEECLSFAQACGNAQAAGRAMTLLGDLSRQQGQYEDSRRRYEHAVALHEAAQDQAGAAAALAGLGTVAYMQGDYASAGVLFEQSLALRRAIGEPWSVAGALSNLGLVTQQRGEYEAAERLFDEALSLRRMLGDQPGMAISLNNLGLVAQRRGDMAAARARHQESLTIKRGLGDSRGIAVSLGNLGEIATASGDLDTARHLLEESIAIKRRLGDRRGLALSLTNLADVTRLQGDNATARVLHMESVTLAMQLGDGALIASNLAGAGYVHTAQGLVASAVRLLAAATALRETIGAPAPPSQRAEQEHVLATLRTALGDAGFAAAWAAGTKLLPEQAVTEALAAISAS